MRTVLFLFFLSALCSAAVYDCNQMTPEASGYFDRRVVIECDLDIEAKPKFVLLSGSSKVPLNKKALYLGKDTGELYERFQVVSNDGVTFGLSLAHNMFAQETPKGAMLSYEPGRKGQLWVCYIRD